jgi:thioredoxin-related protein
MKKLLVLLFALLFIQHIDAQGIEFFNGTFKEALAKAEKENKLVFMDAYAEWCGPCKKMAATVFKDEKVGKFFNDNFVNVKMDMEKGDGPGLQGKYNVTAYPTLLFLNGKGDMVHKGMGALPSKEFLELGRKALGKNDNSKEFEKAYNEGKRDPDLIYSYVRALNGAGKPTMKIVNDYLLKADMSNPTTLKIIYEGASQADSKIFDLLISKRAQIVSLFSEQQVKEKIENACEKTLENALQFKSTELHKLAKDKMKAFLPEKAEEFGLLADLKFYQANGNSKDFCKTCETLIKKEGKTDARKHFSLAKQMLDAFPNDKNVLNDAEKYFKKAAEFGGLSEYYYWYAQTLLRNGKKKDALTSAEKALKLAKELSPNYVPATEQLIEQIKTQG